jgi:anti-sigma-K factor RskA
MNEHDDDKLDLSGLDPLADPRRLDRLSEHIAQRAIAARIKKGTFWGTLVGYSRWAAAMSAATAAGVIFLALTTSTVSSDLPEDDPADVVVLSWAEGDEEPTVSDILQVLGDEP